MNPYFNNNTPSFTFLPQAPAPNHNFTPSPSPIFQPPLNPNNTKQDLLTTLTSLENLITQSKLTLIQAQAQTPSSNDDFALCPFNSNHRLPPKYLFKHYLHCTSSSRVIDTKDIPGFDDLKYRKTAKTEDELVHENPFVGECEGELCFVLDEYIGDFGENFFYKFCPGIVSVYNFQLYNCSNVSIDGCSGGGVKNVFTLPSELSKQCANYNVSRKVLKRESCGGILVSEFMMVENEVRLWRNEEYPCVYSNVVGRVLMSLRVGELEEFGKWVLRCSSRFGVVIDEHMRNHVILLFKLCLKAVSLEACNLSMRVGGDNGAGMFECPVLGEVMKWLGCQLSVLYGELQGRLFCVNMLKQCVLSVAKVKVEGLGEKCERGNFICGDENSSGSLVFVSQVAAAVAALHERAILEDKIKGLRLAGSLSRQQITLEHSFVVAKANDERGKRSNYRPILEHDGLLWQRPHDQDLNKNKTEEEILAEERDYKRRRMSYRGKKAKRSTTEVMRDIIEEHMEEIKDAGGIGCFVKGSAKGGKVPHEPVYVKTDIKIERTSQDYGKHPISYSNIATKVEGPSAKENVKSSNYQQRRDSYGYDEPFEDHCRSRKEKYSRDYSSRSPETSKTEDHRSRLERKDRVYRPKSPENSRRGDHQSRKERYDREYRSKSAENARNREGSHRQHVHRREHEKLEGSRKKSENNQSSSSREANYHDSRSPSLTISSKDLKEQQDRDRYRRRSSRSQRGNYTKEDMFEDRYDPSVSEPYEES